MKAFLIDTTARTVTEVDYGGTLAQAYALIGCDLVEARRLTERGDSLYFDEEGMLRGDLRPFFQLRGQPYPISGNGLVIGRELAVDPIGDDYTIDDCAISLEQLRAAVRFLTPTEAVALWQSARAADKVRMQQLRDEGANVYDAGVDLTVNEHGMAEAL